MFHVVLGPPGSGKTLLTRQVCNVLTDGVLYHEIYEPAVVAEELGKACGLKLGPKGVVDKLLGQLGMFRV